MLTRPIREFPFETPIDRSVAIAGMLTPLVRFTMPHAPMIDYNSPRSRTGKSKLSNINAMLLLGTMAPSFTMGASEEELESAWPRSC